jgi:DNA-binding GntR family transcriptional regulator
VREAVEREVAALAVARAEEGKEEEASAVEEAMEEETKEVGRSRWP